VKIFLDIGANIGQTTKAVLDPQYGFDEVHCFEPSLLCRNHLYKLRKDPRVMIHDFGLSNRTYMGMLYASGSIGASVYKDKPQKVSKQTKNETCQFARASDWFAANLRISDIVCAKMNCEGSECDILDDLMDSGEILKLKVLRVSFDVWKVPSQKHRGLVVRNRVGLYPTVRLVTSNEPVNGAISPKGSEAWLAFTKELS